MVERPFFMAAASTRISSPQAGILQERERTAFAARLHAAENVA
jgi:hypothetical protein